MDLPDGQFLLHTYLFHQNHVHRSAWDKKHPILAHLKSSSPSDTGLHKLGHTFATKHRNTHVNLLLIVISPAGMSLCDFKMRMPKETTRNPIYDSAT